jgi:hypothetical protein
VRRLNSIGGFTTKKKLTESALFLPSHSKVEKLSNHPAVAIMDKKTIPRTYTELMNFWNEVAGTDGCQSPTGLLSRNSEFSLFTIKFLRANRGSSVTRSRRSYKILKTPV